MTYNKRWLGIISMLIFMLIIIGLTDNSKNIISNCIYPVLGVTLFAEISIRIINWVLKKTNIKKFYNKIWFWIIIVAICIPCISIVSTIALLYLMTYWYHWIYFEYTNKKAIKSNKENIFEASHIQSFKEKNYSSDMMKNMPRNEELNAIALNELEHVDSLTGFAFEKYVAQLLLKCGYNNVYNTVKQGDFGIDVVASKHNIKYGFQCKLYKNSVGYKAIQETLAGGKYYHIKKCVVVTNRRFTKNAKKAAKSFGITLWNRNDLKQLIIKSYKK